MASLSPASTPAALAVSALRKSYAGSDVVAGLSFAVAPGTCFGLLGPNGAGKTTTLRLCLGLTGPDGGEITLGGHTIPADAQAARARVGDSQRGLSALGSVLSRPYRQVTLGGSGPSVGSYSFLPDEPPEVMTAAQTAELLQIEEKQVLVLAADGELPGRKLGKEWRFSRAAVLDWLANPSKK